MPRIHDNAKAWSDFLNAQIVTEKARQNRRRAGQTSWWTNDAQDDPNPEVKGRFSRVKARVASAKWWTGKLGRAVEKTGDGLRAAWDFPTPAVLRGPLHAPYYGPVYDPPWKRRSNNRQTASASGNGRVAPNEPARASNAATSVPPKEEEHHERMNPFSDDNIEPAHREEEPRESTNPFSDDNIEPAPRPIGEPVSQFSSSSTRTGADATRSDSAAANFFRRASATLGLSKLARPERPNPRGYRRL